MRKGAFSTIKFLMITLLIQLIRIGDCIILFPFYTAKKISSKGVSQQLTGRGGLCDRTKISDAFGSKLNDQKRTNLIRDVIGNLKLLAEVNEMCD